MKLPSLRLALQDARDTFWRFPVIIADAALGTCAAFILIDHEGAEEPTILFKILLAAVLGLPLLLSFGLYSDRQRHGRTQGLLLQGAGILLLFLYSFTVPLDMRSVPESVMIRFVLLGAALCFLVLAMPSIAGATENGFWDFNWRLFVRVLLTGFYTGVLFAGFALGLAALDNLFGVHVRPQRYGELWVLLLGIFAPWFLLAGIPADRPQIEAGIPYPKGLKAFGLYILGPIVLAYLIILYAYLIKILQAWDWPKGWVSGLIFGFASCGILVTVILKPLVEKEGMSWIMRAIRWFYLVLIPVIVMLFLALGRRIAEYGITESRYLGFIVAGWFVLLVVYNLLSSARMLRFIPFSLCVISFAISFGPWGMLAVSESSQIARLERLLTASGVLKEGKVTLDHKPVPLNDTREISGVLGYLYSRHRFDGIQPWFKEELHADMGASGVQYKTPAAVAQLMGIAYVQSWEGAHGGGINLSSTGGFPVSGYQRMARLVRYDGIEGKVDSLAGEIRVKTMNANTLLVFTLQDTSKHLLTVDLGAHIDAILAHQNTTVAGALPDSVLMLRASGNGLAVCLCPWQIHARTDDQKIRIHYLDAVLLYSVSPGQ